MVIYKKDIDILKANLVNLPRFWDGKTCVLELKEADYNWRQMEWWAFYFEYKVKNLLADKFTFPGDRYDNVSFDLKGEINWDLKAKAIKSDDHKVILNDKSAMEQSIEKLGFHGEIIALCDVEYNDNDRSFQKWHTELKGGKSTYEMEREARTSISRYRKTKAELTEIILFVLQKSDLEKLTVMRQGRNSNGKPRPEKYMLDLETIDNFENYIIKM
jgi:hypothetical protein